MKSFRYRLLIAALAVLLGTVAGHSQTAEDTPPPMHGHRIGMGMGMGGHMGFLAKQLNLTDDQKSQMKAIWQKEMKPLFQQQRQIDLQLRQLGEGTFDANAQSQVQTLATQKAQMIVAETRIHNEMYQLLTPDQQTQLKAIEAKHEARRQQHMNQNEPPAPPEQ